LPIPPEIAPVFAFTLREASAQVEPRAFKLCRKSGHFSNMAKLRGYRFLVVDLTFLSDLLWRCGVVLRSIQMRIWLYLAAVAAACFLLSPITVAMAEDQKPHRLVIQVDQDDPAVMNLALNNATNVLDYYRAKGESVDLDIVTYGPGLTMLRADTSPVKDRIKRIKDLAFPSTVQFSACNNTRENMEKKEGHPVTIVSEAVLVPSGVVRLMELQEKGWSYLRP
jgi:intracellular sulfur oxidation DsrE/DsrF family protein